MDGEQDGPNNMRPVTHCEATVGQRKLSFGSGGVSRFGAHSFEGVHQAGTICEPTQSLISYYTRGSTYEPSN